MAIEKIVNPLISVIIPVYNGEKHLKQAIESVLNQGHDFIEIIVINDGSLDNSHEIINSFKDKIRSYSQENSGVASSRNLGISKAKGLFITFLDQDDYYPMGRFINFLKTYRKSKELIFIGHTQYIFEDEKAKLRWPNLPKNNIIFVRLLGASIFHKTVFTDFGLFIPELKSGDDIEWFYRLKQSGVEINQSEDVVLCYRQHSTNVSADKKQVDKYLLSSLKYILDAKKNIPNNKN
jgi:glycosyltransferase involved in cell wall biosynthesis